MSITTYSELQSAIASKLHRDDLSGDIPEFIQFGELRLNRELRVAGLESVSTDTCVSGTASYALPSDCLAVRSVQLNTDPVRVLEQTTPDNANKYFSGSATGKPYVYSQIGSSLYLYDTPDSNYTYQLTYYAKPTALSGSNTSNWYLANVPDLLLYASLVYGADLIENQRKLEKYEAVYQKALQEIRDSDTNDRWSSSNMRTRVG